MAVDPRHVDQFVHAAEAAPQIVENRDVRGLRVSRRGGHIPVEHDQIAYVPKFVDDIAPEPPRAADNGCFRHHNFPWPRGAWNCSRFTKWLRNRRVSLEWASPKI